MIEGLIVDVERVGQNALKRWGSITQATKTCEECAELIVQLSKYVNGSPTTNEAIIDEIADALFMVLQMRMAFGFEQVDRRLRYKINRTAVKLEELKHSHPG